MHVYGATYRNFSGAWPNYSYVGKPSVGRWQGKVTGDTLRFVRQRDGMLQYELQVSGSNRMQGRFNNELGTGSVWLTRQ